MTRRQHGNHSTILATKFDPDHDDPATFLQTKFVVFGQRAEWNDDDRRMWLTSSLPTDFEIRDVDQTLLTDRLRIYVESRKARSWEMKWITDTVANLKEEITKTNQQTLNKLNALKTGGQNRDQSDKRGYCRNQSNYSYRAKVSSNSDKSYRTRQGNRDENWYQPYNRVAYNYETNTKQDCWVCELVKRIIRAERTTQPVPATTDSKNLEIFQNDSKLKLINPPPFNRFEFADNLTKIHAIINKPHLTLTQSPTLTTHRFEHHPTDQQTMAVDSKPNFCNFSKLFTLFSAKTSIPLFDATEFVTNQLDRIHLIEQHSLSRTRFVLFNLLSGLKGNYQLPRFDLDFRKQINPELPVEYIDRIENLLKENDCFARDEFDIGLIKEDLKDFAHDPSSVDGDL